MNDWQQKIREEVLSERTAWMLVAAATALLAGKAAQAGLKVGWKALKHEEPPVNPAAPGATWQESLTWAVIAGVAVGVTTVIATRAASAAWKEATGELPPDVREKG